jgi:prophage regulatory protein
MRASSHQLKTQEQSPALRLLRLPRVKDRVGLGRSTIYLLVARGQFPRPLSLGGRAMAWLESDIDHWIQTKVEAARVPTGGVPSCAVGGGRE